MMSATIRTRLLWAASLLIAASGIARAQTTNITPAKPDSTAQADSAETLQPTLVAASQAMLTAAQRGDADAMLKVATPDLLFVSRPAMAMPDHASIVRCTPGEPTLSNPQARQTSPVSAVLTYKLHQPCSDTTQPADQAATDNFVQQDGKWLIAVHTQSPVGR